MAITVGAFFHAVFLLLFVVGSHATGPQVRDIKLPHIGPDTVTVTWTAPKQPHGDIKSYHVTVTNRDANEQQEFETTSNGITLRNLTPNTRYHITVRTANKHFNGNVDGLGEPVLIVLTTEPLAGGQVTDIKFLHIGTETATITWTAPNQQHGDIKSYHVTLTNRDATEHQDLETTTNEITFSNLTPHTWYDILVRIENRQLNSNGGGLVEPVQIEFLTMPLADRQVTDIKFLHIGTDTATVIWEAPKQPHGDIKSYHVTITNRDTKEQQTIERTSNGIIFPNLTPHTWYDILVRIENRQLNSNVGGLGEPVQIEFLTMPLAGQQVTDIKFLHIGTDNATVLWEAPKQPHGDIKSYHVTLTNRDATEHQDLETTTNEITFSNLTPHTWYDILVRIENRQLNSNGGGLGEPVQIEFLTMPLAGQLVTDIKCLHIGTDTATVIWEAPKQPLGDIMSYHVTITNRDTKEQQTFEITSNGIIFPNLTPHTRYDILVRTENRQLNGIGGGLGEPVQIEFLTMPLGKYEIDGRPSRVS